jgi:hypothetical protein
MTLRRPKGMRQYFRDVQGRTDEGAKFEREFDQFYLCMMVGLSEAKLAGESDLAPVEFNVDYTAPFHAHAPTLAGPLMDSEMRRQDVPPTKDAVQKEILKVIDVRNSNTRLKDHGTKLLSRYAARGLQTIKATIPSPRTLEDVLVAYHARWNLEAAVGDAADDETSVTESGGASHAVPTIDVEAEAECR